MANFTITPSAGADIRTTYAKLEPGSAINLGTVQKAKDGHDYVFAKNGGTEIDASTAVILTEPAFTVAAGAGAWTTQDFAVPANHYAWFKRVAI